MAPDTFLTRLPTWQSLLLLCFALLGLRALLIHFAGLELHFDEAQYWEWSRRPDWSYYSKGPLAAWSIHLSTTLFGHGEWQVRLPAWLAAGGFVAVLFYFARDLWGSAAAGWWAVLLGATTPVYFALGSVMSTDIFLFLCWTLALWTGFRALYRDAPTAWYGCGAAVGIGALGKLSIGLVPFFLGLFVLFRKPAVLRNPHLWGGLGLLFVCMVQVIWWNSQHDWVMLRHELGHAGLTETAPAAYDWNDLLDFIAGQWLMLSPLVALVWIPLLLRPPRLPEQRLIWGISWLVLAFFIVKALHAKVQPNWPAPAYIGLLVLFAGRIPELSKRLRGFVLAGIAIGSVLLGALFFTPHLGIDGKRDPFKKLKHWRAPVFELARQSPDSTFLLVPYYQLAGELAFYWPEPIEVYLTGSAGRRMNQYDLWPSVNREAGRDGAFVSTMPGLPPTVAAAFDACHALLPVPAYTVDGQVLRTLYGWDCRGYRVTEWPRPEGF